MPYLGKTPSQATRKRYYKTASAGDTSVSGTMTVGGTLTFTDGEFVDVSVNGVALVAGTDYNTNTANTIAGLSALSANDQVEIVVYDTFSVFGGNVDGDFTVSNGTLTAGTVDINGGAVDGTTIGAASASTGAFTTISASGNVDFNGDLDVDGTTNLDAVDIDGAVDMASTLQVDGSITSSANATITTAGNSAQLTLVSTDDDANLGPLLSMFRNSSSPADSDLTGKIEFNAEDSAGNATTYTSISSRIRDVTNGTEDGELKIEVRKDGTNRESLTLKEDETVFNEAGVDTDFRVESSGNANMLVVDAGNDRIGIGTNAPGAELDIESTGPTIHMNDSDGVLGGAITNRILMQASGSTHGVVGFGTSAGNMAVTNANGTLFLQADTNDAHSDSQILFTVDNSTKARINASGIFLVGKSSASATGTGVIIDKNGQSFFGADTEPPIVVNRNNNDGNLVLFMQADSVEGTISVSGSTVSYNGGHLSRWSQATDGNRIDGLLKGTVMTNLDQMAVWSHGATEAVDAVIDADGNVITEAVEAKDAYTEINEQLNCMAVSSVEGDANVAGVFVNWDDDDDFNDMNVAMTGDMVIRIAQGTTVARGDLLMSAGDGTAKPQDDDIVRSKTIAKVTSTTKSHTYDDGSYLVPCVLMAC